MPDVFSRAKRSAVMSRIRSRGNRDTELALARLLRAHGITGWRRHVLVRATVESRWLRVDGSKAGKRSGGKGHQPSAKHHQLTVRPDFVFSRQRTVVFVDGCFWHGCPKHSHPGKWLRKSSMPNKPSPTGGGGRTGRAFWQAKLAANMARDRKMNRALRRAGWRVVRIWEHELKAPARVVRRVARAMEE
jgi:DNA mismatch endonuclease (patch repair protein)